MDPIPRGKRGPPRSAPRDANGRIIPKNRRAAHEAAVNGKSHGIDDSNLPEDMPAPIPDLPPKRVGGLPNARYYAAAFAYLNDQNMRMLASGEGGVPNYKTALEGILKEAEFNGIDKDSVVDNRPVEVKLRELADRFVDMTVDQQDENLLETQDGLLSTLDKLMLDTIKDANEHCEAMVMKMTHEQASRERDYRLAQKRLRAGKVWRDRIEMVRRLKDLARNPVPHCMKQKVTTELKQHSMQASHLLRYMLYTMRTNLSEKQAAGGAASLLRFAKHHVKMAVRLYMGANSLDVTHEGFRERHNKYYSVIMIVPPGHGKTTMATGFFANRMSRNPYRKLKIGHAIEDKSCDNVTYVSSFFKPDNPTGRRNLALHEHIPRVVESSNYHLVFDTQERSRSANITGDGATAKVGGDDVDDIWFDDFVDEEERHSELLRTRKKNKLKAWMHRKRDPKTSLDLTTATAWHEDDANMSRVKASREGKDPHTYVIRMYCGGPPTFDPLWPEMYGGSHLRKEYASDPFLYSAAYQSNPRSQELQLIKKLRFYDNASDTHREFLSGATYYVSVDPAATNREKSDKAGVIYAALGDVTGVVTHPDGREELTSERRLRILSAHQITADIDGAKQYIYAHSYGHRVDFVAIEEVGFSGSLRVQISNELGIDCIPCPTHSKSKEMRLKAVSALIEDRHVERGGGAVVEFPGVRNENGTIKCDPEYDWLRDQFYRFGATKNDHCLDAVTQLVAYLTRTGELQAGTGFVTDKVRAATGVVDGDPRIAKWLDEVMQKDSKKRESVEIEDWNFMATLN